MSNLASRMAAAMKVAKLNQPQLAKVASTSRIRVSQQVVQHLLSGRNSTSKYLPAIAEALSVSLEWLAVGRGSMRGKHSAEALLIGKVGPGGEVMRFAEPLGAGIPSPPDLVAPNVLLVSGNSQYPLRNGWRLFYGPECQGVAEDCLGNLCVVQIKDGLTLLRVPKRSSNAKGLYRLESWNAPARDRVQLAWAARVLDIRPQ
jgi:hypothetical protein